jgi:hypothetical protein
MDWATKLNKFDDAGNLIQMGIDPLDAMGNFVDTWSTMADVSYISEDKKTFLFDNEALAIVVGYIAKLWQDIRGGQRPSPSPSSGRNGPAASSPVTPTRRAL